LKHKYTYKLWQHFQIPPTIHKTTDYNIFVNSVVNREVDDNHVKELMKSFEEHPELIPHNPAILAPHPTESGKFHVIEGQHSIEALIRLQWPIYYTIGDKLQDRHAPVLNSSQKNWRNENYLHSYAKQGFSNYVKLEKILAKYPQAPTTPSISIMHMGSPKSRFAVREFKLKRLKDDYADDLVQLFKELEKLDKAVAEKAPDQKQFAFNSRFIHAYYRLWKYPSKDSFDTKRFLKQVQKYPHTFLPQIDVREYERMIEKVYNFNRRGKSVKRLF
jgi:hypothetical protein